MVRPEITTTYSSLNIFNCSSGGGYIFVLVTNTSGLGTITYTWSSSETTARITPSVAGNYIVTITDGFGCTNTNSYNIIDTRPVVDASFTYSTPCVSQAVNFTNTGTTGSGVTYKWVVNSPIIVSGTTSNFLYTFLTAGKYTVTHTVTNTCSKSVTDTINVVDCSVDPYRNSHQQFSLL